MTSSSNFNYQTPANQVFLGFPSSTEALQQEIDSDDADSRPGKRSGRRKIKIEYIEDKSRRHITFSKRKAGIMKKAYELSTLTGTQVLLLVVSETGLVYTFTTPKLKPLVTKSEGKSLIQECLNAPDLSHLSMADTTAAQAQAQAQAQAHSMQRMQQQQPVNTTATNPPVLAGNARIGHSTLFPYPSQKPSKVYAQLERKPSLASDYSSLYPSPYSSNIQRQQHQQPSRKYPPTPQEFVDHSNSSDYWQQRNHHPGLQRQL
ncbi:unnamed protein product [Mucor circinelloides]